ncbi:hypothetical protein FO131_19530 [Salmonella bongori]|uniref:hypothetical protein n=1 Tax=Salmonella bongori TaxID=54736 RepID=UPI00128069FA|nr:hypothetical protein [Salmonella bongori]ECG8259006.1 hypothetical protein [Salmonella bongori serovar 48:i:-]ECG9254700.1 hypothetical protein [Salmonella bongori]EDP8708166.1 hypothetical protein [Salmonella bongori]EDP8725786.1 hypothetical protein [Salmonella bongori]EEO9371542.1 hypothetical protein [Salmonella bongori]
MKKLILGILLIFTFTISGCSTPTPDDFCNQMQKSKNYVLSKITNNSNSNKSDIIDFSLDGISNHPNAYKNNQSHTCDVIVTHKNKKTEQGYIEWNTDPSGYVVDNSIQFSTDNADIERKKLQEEKSAKQQKDALLSAQRSPILGYCEDLMTQVRGTYGKAPHCFPVAMNGIDYTDASGLVALSDKKDGRNPYYYLTITPGQFKGDYYYKPHEIDTLVSLMRYDHRGVSR